MKLKTRLFIFFLDLFYWPLRIFYSKNVLDRAWMLQTFKGSDIRPSYCDTPDAIIQNMITAAKDEYKKLKHKPALTYICEPEFGTGMMLQQIDAAFKRSNITGYEINPGLFAQAGAIYKKISSFGNNYVTLYNCDFLGVKPKQNYNLIFMNPPYSGREFIKHIEHAIDMLQDEGILIALLPETVFYSVSISSLAFRDNLNRYEVQVDRLGPVVCSYPVSVCMLKLVNKKSAYYESEMQTIRQLHNANSI